MSRILINEPFFPSSFIIHRNVKSTIQGIKVLGTMKKYISTIEQNRDIPPHRLKVEDDSNSVIQPKVFLNRLKQNRLYSDVYKIVQEVINHAK